MSGAVGPQAPVPQNAGQAGHPPDPAQLSQRAPLAREMAAAALAIEWLERGRRLPDSLDAAAAQHQLPAASRAPLRDITSAAVRQLGLCSAIARQLNRKPPPPLLAALQRVALSLLLQAQTPPAAQDPAPAVAPAPGDGPAGSARARHPAVVVDQAVQAARLLATDAAVPFINATLRRFLRERDALLAAVADDPVARYNFPGWWIDQMRADYPQQWQAILAGSDQPAPLTLRVNLRRCTVAAMHQALLDAGHQVDQVGPVALRLDRSTDVTRLPGFVQGWFSVQDAGAQMAAVMLDPADGQRVLDACAAPGGKTAHLLELADCELLALDVDRHRLPRVQQNLDRLGLAAQVKMGDAARPDDWWDGRPFDRILLDAPCSASGIVRRHPDIRWLRRRSDLATLSRQQTDLLAALWPLLKPGGKLLYATCSVFRAENEQSIARFLRANGDARQLPLNWPWPPETPEQPVSQLLPRADPLAGTGGRSVDHDGFYYVLLQKPP